MHSLTVPDWQLLLMKLEIPISDDGWQSILNRTHLGKGSRSSGSDGVLLSKNSMKAMKSFVFEKVEGLFGIEKIENEDIPGYQVGLEPVVCWQARELRLQGHCPKNMQLNLKLDGRPFGGRSQVLVGVVPTETVKWSNHSCKSFCPLAIANCKEDRVSLQRLISKLNREKDAIKRNGIRIDGQLLNVTFKVTLDLKALYLLLVKDDDETFKLGGKGLCVEFCFFCRALRNCDCDLGPDEVCLTHLSETKANIGSFKGIRDDLTFLLEEELTSINLCALHCELRNTEQLLGSLGLYAFRIGSLDECNAALAKYGPETSGDRIKIKMKENQQTVVAKHNIQVTSFSGNTERNILRNIEEIVHQSLPLESLKEQFRNPKLAKETILNKIAFCSQQIRHYEKMMGKKTFTRDFGKYEEEIPLKGSVAYEKMVQYRNSWKKILVEMKTKLGQYSSYFAVEGISQKRNKKKTVSQLDGLSEYAAQVIQEFYLKVFTSWREIATVIRTGVFSQEQQHLIDEFDLQCKDWGFLLREMFGPLLGTGDYGHMTIEHSSMLLRVFGSIREYSNQSIEAAHSLQRQLYSKATSHDRHGYISSIRQLLLHFYSERILFLRLCFRNALECSNQGKPFHFVGCGWTMAHGRAVNWSTAEIEWIKEMDKLMTKIFGNDYLQYESDKITKTVHISPQSTPEFVYDHDKWEDGIVNVQPLDPPDFPFQPSSSAVNSQDNSAPVPPTVPDANTVPNVQMTSTQPSSSAVNSHDNSTPVPPTVPDVKKVPSNLYPDLKKCLQRNLTRRELASLELPPVVHLSKLDLDIVQNPVRLSNPFVIAARPPNSIVQYCTEMLQQHRTISSSPVNCDDDDDDDDEVEGTGIQVGGLGVFNQHSINVWTSAVQASTIKDKVGREVKWLANNNGLLSHQQQTAIENVLFDSRATEEVLAIGDSIVDVNDLSTLIAERYLTGFVIDVTCLKLKEQSRGHVKTIYLPTSFQDWASTGNVKYLKTKMSRYTQDDDVANSHFLLTPINVSGAHWGLLCLNLKSMQAYYDDGLHWDPPDNILDLVKILLKTLNQLARSCLQFNENTWDLTLPLERFGMPTQPPGSGSCSMGVILSAQSIMNAPAPKIPMFAWSYQEMKKHRINLLNSFVAWKNEAKNSV